MACSACEKRRQATMNALKIVADAARKALIAMSSTTPGQRPAGIVKNSVIRNGERR